MRLTNYRPEDIETVIEIKKMVQHQIATIEVCNWTDEVEEAIVRTEDMLNNLHQIRKMKYEKVFDDNTNILVSRLKSQGINAQAFKFTHKKAD